MQFLYTAHPIKPSDPCQHKTWMLNDDVDGGGGACVFPQAGDTSKTDVQQEVSP